MIKDLDKKIRAYTLKNAVHYDGKANPGSVISALFNEGLEKSEVKSVMPKIQEEIKKISKLSLDEQKKELEEFENFISERSSREGLPELPNVAKTGVVMRFRPGPSGAMHVGHVISNIYSSLYVKKYGGKFYVVVDDTDPKTCLAEAYDWIKRDCDWIFGNVTEYINSSDRIKNHYNYAEKFIKKDFAYVCICSQEGFNKFVETKKDCPCRKNSVKENLNRWKKMLDQNGFNEGEAVLRFKSDMKNPNPAMRDFPLARICLHEHPIQGNKYRVWPLMNLAVFSDDVDLSMTHIIRGKDHMDNAKRQEMMYHALEIKKIPWTAFIGRLKFSDLNLSKRKIKAAIESGEYEGFDDERLPTLISLQKRKYNPEAFAKFAEQRGLTEVDKVIDSKEIFKILDNFNKEI